MKGIEKLREKLPDYQGKKIYKIVLLAPVTFIFSIGFQFFFDSLPRIFPYITFLQILSPFTPIFGSIIIMIVGLLVVYNFWRVRDKNLKKYHEKAYQKSFKLVMVGVPLVLSVVIHGFFPTNLIKPYQDKHSISWYLANPLTDYFTNLSTIFFYVRLVLFIFFIIVGMIVVSRALKIFGIDYMGLVYIYYPEESTLQNHEIYSVLRHPTYHTLMLFSIGSIFLRCSIYSIIYFVIFIIGIKVHLKFVEEKELIQRFGESYINYKKKVPALLVRRKDLGKYFHFLFKG